MEEGPAISQQPAATSAATRHLIACEVFRDEFEAVCPPEMPRTYLEQGLHRTPGKMPEAIQAVVDGLPADVETVILGYGLCSNGVVGVTARRAPIVLPKVHDCIAVLLGSVARYEAEMNACAGTYYITPGWVKYGTTSLSAYKGRVSAQVRGGGRPLRRGGVPEALLADCVHRPRRRGRRAGSGPRPGIRRDLRQAATRRSRATSATSAASWAGPWDAPDFLTIPPGTAIDQAPLPGPRLHQSAVDGR